jgi:nicotinate-nucleotide pyrophosphorylase (carboxylating)
MLDNMDLKDIKDAVKIRDNTDFKKSHHAVTKLEASGGISLDNIKQVAATGVDIISVGELTHSVKSIDISLEVL